MSASEPVDLSRLCIHTITTKPWDIDTAIEKYATAGVKGITVWRQWLEGRNPQMVGETIRKAGLETVSLCRGGFFPAPTESGRQTAIDDNKRALDEAAALDAPWVVLVPGAHPDLPLHVSRDHIRDGIAAVLDHARSVDVKLAVEPLHPMYADSRSAINTLQQANDLCDVFNDPFVGVAVDVYHLWWDPDLKNQIKRCGNSGYLFAFHICDWKTPTEDLLNDRGLMGEGCIPIREIRGWVEEMGFRGYNEVEIFSTRWWNTDQDDFLSQIVKAYQKHS